MGAILKQSIDKEITWLAQTTPQQAAPEKSVPRAVLRVVAAAGDLLGAWSRRRITPPLTLQSFAASAVEVTVNSEKARREPGYAPVGSRQQGLDEMRAARAGQQRKELTW